MKFLKLLTSTVIVIIASGCLLQKESKSSSQNDALAELETKQETLETLKLDDPYCNSDSCINVSNEVDSLTSIVETIEAERARKAAQAEERAAAALIEANKIIQTEIPILTVRKNSTPIVSITNNEIEIVDKYSCSLTYDSEGVAQQNTEMIEYTLIGNTLSTIEKYDCSYKNYTSNNSSIYGTWEFQSTTINPSNNENCVNQHDNSTDESTAMKMTSSLEITNSTFTEIMSYEIQCLFDAIVGEYEYEYDNNIRKINCNTWEITNDKGFTTKYEYVFYTDKTYKLIETYSYEGKSCIDINFSDKMNEPCIDRDDPYYDCKRDLRSESNGYKKSSTIGKRKSFFPF